MKKTIGFYTVALCILFCFSATCLAGNTVFTSYGSHDEVNNTNHVNYTFDDDGEKVTYKTDGQGNLHLYSKKTGEDYLSFIPYIGNPNGSTYKVREVHTESPKMTFYEIISLKDDAGTGYWLIGKTKGKWVTYISLDSLANMGMKSGSAHEISSNIIDDRLVIRTAVNGKTDCAVEPFWDNSAKWFGVKSVTARYRNEEAKAADVWVAKEGAVDVYVVPHESYKKLPYRYVVVKRVLSGVLISKDTYIISELGPENWKYRIKGVSNKNDPKNIGESVYTASTPDSVKRIVDWMRANIG
ncbi:hypothetical protein SAMN02745671_02571 [Anaerovibrio lipolyticus DSM 3074]|uniref:Uncharacterized protein n=1 Tax=Anaerovibrio lipolyticus DSM 3074 TaxID=1120997 RepID=A0A1M6G9T5_9FIRM|nr:hypothetical protein [Anaerovibrio lipolyticus]SHJ06689.1 hypothetical protein SAMN02745671_02571 [Anaerovibrio lipolyticus DSM 3074]